MPLIASLAKIAALTVALTCVGATVPSTERAGTVVTAGDSTAGQLRCRLYFGCVPVARTAAESLVTKE